MAGTRRAGYRIEVDGWQGPRFFLHEEPRVSLRSCRLLGTTSPLFQYVGIDLVDWRQANDAIRRMAALAPAAGYGVHRVWFALTWVDGLQHGGRIDLDERKARIERPLSIEVWSALAFQAGRSRPPGVPLTDYLAAVDELGADTRDRARRLLDHYDLGLVS